MSENEFTSAKSSLLKYYSDARNSLGTRLFAFSVLLFALFQIASWNNNLGLSGIIGNFTIVDGYRLFLFFTAVFIVVVYMVRTAFRFASVSGVCNWLIVIEHFDIKTKSIHAELASEVYQQMVAYSHNTKVFLFFPFYWFVQGIIGEDKELALAFNNESAKYGWTVSIILGFAILVSFILVYQRILFPV